MRNLICEKIKGLRIKHHYLQEEVAEALNMSQNSYSELETGKRKLDIDRLYQIAQLYKISLNDLLEKFSSPEK